MAASTSGTYGYAPTAGELIFYSFAQAGVKRTAIQEEHLVNARMAANLVLVDMANDQPKLWKVELLSIPLVQGVAQYQLPGNVILALDVYLRTFSLPNVSNVAPDFSTVASTPLVTIGLTNHGLEIGQWVQVVVPVSVGGLIIQGFYQVTAVPNGNAFTITAAAAATATVNNGGAVPQFNMTANSSVVTVVFPNNGQISGFTWNIPVATSVGGVGLSGGFTVQTVVDANTFTIAAPQNAAFTDSEYENGGQAQFAAQSQTVQPTDRIVWPVGRSEFAAYPNKQYQAPPTVAWFDRLTAPQLNLYPTPDGNGPYTLQVYAVTQMQDVNPVLSETVDVPYRYLAAFAAGLAKELAVIYAPDRLAMLEARYNAIYGRAEKQDTERVPMYILPSISGYFRR